MEDIVKMIFMAENIDGGRGWWYNERSESISRGGYQIGERYGSVATHRIGVSPLVG